MHAVGPPSGFLLLLQPGKQQQHSKKRADGGCEWSKQDRYVIICSKSQSKIQYRNTSTAFNFALLAAPIVLISSYTFETTFCALGGYRSTFLSFDGSGKYLHAVCRVLSFHAPIPNAVTRLIRRELFALRWNIFSELLALLPG